MTIEEACKNLENFPYYTLKESQEVAIKTLIDFAKKNTENKDKICIGYLCKNIKEPQFD
jgi:hypothetical protein